MWCLQPQLFQLRSIKSRIARAAVSCCFFLDLSIAQLKAGRISVHFAWKIRLLLSPVKSEIVLMISKYKKLISKIKKRTWSLKFQKIFADYFRGSSVKIGSAVGLLPIDTVDATCRQLSTKTYRYIVYFDCRLDTVWQLIIALAGCRAY